MPTREPRLEVLRPLGTGATAQVELVRLCEPWAGLPAGSELARKTLEPALGQDPVARAAFLREAEVAQAVRDPALARVFHQGFEADRPYLLLQYVPGRTLRELLDQEGPLPEPLLRAVGADLAGALSALHEQGFAHGDVKPENARLDEEGRAVLLDLGFARTLRAAEGVQTAGSLAYLSPERTRGEPASAESDVFALGIVLYELATGLHPFGHGRQPGRLVRGSSQKELLRRSIELRGADELLSAIGAARTVPPSRFVPTLSPFLDRLSSELLARVPGERPTAREVEQRLRAGEMSPWWRRAIDPETHDVAGPAQARSAFQTFPLVGRERELGQLARLLEAVRTGPRPRAAVAWIVGPEGSGKWRLGLEFAERARASSDPPLFLDLRWSESDEMRPGGALLMLVNRWLRLPEGSAPGPRDRERLSRLVEPAGARVLEQALAPRGAAAPGLESALSAALSTWLGALARTRTVLVFLDDLHLAGQRTLAQLGALLEAQREARCAFLLSLREDTRAAEPGTLTRLRERLERGSGGAGPLFARIELSPLELSAVGELVGLLFHPATPERRLAEVLWKKSRGNAGFLTEILRQLESQGALRPAAEDDPRWVLTISPDELPLPRSLDRLIQERVRALEPEERMWLERLSVAGGRIEPEYLQQAFPPTKRSEIDSVLARLVRKGWLVPAADRYRFERPALREALYRSLSPGRRKRLHLAAARALVQAGPPADIADTFQRAFHLQAAGEDAQLLSTVQDALARLERRASARQVLTLARWGLTALERAPDVPSRERVQLELFEAAADAADRLGQREDQRVLLDRLSALVLDLERMPAEGARLYLLHGRYAAGTGQFGLARGWLKTSVQLARRAGDRALHSQALRRLAQVQSQIGEFSSARKLARAALEQAVGENQVALAHLALAHVDVLEDRSESALAEVEAALETLLRTDQARAGVSAYAELLRGRVWRSAGLPREALGSNQRALRLARQAGERRLEAEALARRGGLLLDLGRVAPARAALREARHLADEIEDRRAQVLTGLWLGQLEAEAGEGEAAARPGLLDSLELAREIGFYRAEAVGLTLLARCARAAGDPEGAGDLSAQAAELLARHGAELADRIVIAGTHALLLRERGRAGEAARVLADLERRVRQSYRRIDAPELRAAQKGYAERLRAAVLSGQRSLVPPRS